jgi:hypothetical protein
MQNNALHRHPPFFSVEEVCTDFFEIYTLCLKSKNFRAAKRDRFEILRDFIRFAVRAAKAGL